MQANNPQIYTPGYIWIQSAI